MKGNYTYSWNIPNPNVYRHIQHTPNPAPALPMHASQQFSGMMTEHWIRYIYKPLDGQMSWNKKWIFNEILQVQLPDWDYCLISLYYF